jgi:uncharacterized integral membrane protein (TIGR00698 family)
MPPAPEVRGPVPETSEAPLPASRERRTSQVVVFAATLAFCLSPWASPPLALGIGLVVGLLSGHPYPRINAKATKVLLQASVVGLGFGMNLERVLEAGRTGFLFTVATISGTLLCGFLVARILAINPTIALLISSGTAICGGSAIAAVAPVIDASDEEISVALGTVFILNSVALFLFPMIGTHLGMTQRQFGVWAAIAIHDTSSVVGAAAKFGSEALQIATTVKLTRALWIVPLTLAAALIVRKRGSDMAAEGDVIRRAKITIPWFIFWFLVASVIRTLVPGWAPLWNGATVAARIGLTVTLFLIGAGLSLDSLREVGIRPLLLGIILWVAISMTSLTVVRALL